MIKKLKKIGLLCLIGMISLSCLAGCGNNSQEKIVIYTNSDEEAIKVMEDSLNNAGYNDQFIIQGIGTSELGGKLLAEGKEIEADLVTMSSYYLESANEKNNMFIDLSFERNNIMEVPKYYTPILANTGAIFVNTKALEENKLEKPKSIRDLTKSEYKNQISIPNIMDSSTGWLLVQAIVGEYGEEEGKKILKDLLENCGPHLESSGSGPIKKVRAGEVAVGFGLRHQAVQDKLKGMPIDYIDPTEGNFSLTESIAVVNKDDEKNKLAMEMAKVIVDEGRKELINYYPVSLYKGEEVSNENKTSNSKVFDEKLTVDLLEKHQEFFKDAKNK